MLNNNITVEHPKVTNNVSIKRCPGGIYKSHPKSRIVGMHITSISATNMLSTIVKPIVNGNEVVVLQIVNVADGYVLVEYMYKEDYEAENVYSNPDGSGRKDE